MTGSRPTDGMEEFNRRVDFGRTSADYARYRAGFPQEFFDRLRRFDIGLPGQRLLDLGAGTGAIARAMAAAGCHATALDPARPQLQEARRLAEDAGLALETIVAKAEGVPLVDATFDVVTAGQCWHWFDRARVAAEVRRLLVDGGALVIAHFDWLPLPGNVVEATERLIERYNPAWHFGGATGFYPQWVPGLTAAGFTDLETFSFDQEVPYSHEAWRGRTRANAGVAASLSAADVSRFDQDLAQLLAERFPTDPMAVPHRVFAIIARSRAVDRRV
ncbi:MAG TPA: methyltransferase domain-containing protein [Pirellulales bacterium]|nr:methyltransferase domain-containing protein [Pirellulales bacterium]